MLIWAYGHPWWFLCGMVGGAGGLSFLTAKVLMQNGYPWWGHSLPATTRVWYPLVSSVGFNTVVFPLKERLYPYTGSLPRAAGVAVAPQMYFIDTFTIRRQTNQGVSLSMVACSWFRYDSGRGCSSVYLLWDVSQDA